ncbi:MAG TPA: DUF11 domain-containing protein [Gemmataceae bacterium]|nr:DUF11 domain-containing protein [Gemmataceae bacterium]
MTARHYTIGLALGGVLGCLAAGLLAVDAGRSWADPLGARPAQFAPPSQEPPLADAPAPPTPAPAATSPPAPGTPVPPPVFAPGGGTVHPEDPPVPVVAIRVRVPASAVAGQDLEYQICVENRSQAPAHHVMVRNPLPANTRFVRASPEPSARDPELVWQLGTLPAGACRNILLVLSPTGTGDVQDCARVQFEHGECVCTHVAQLAMAQLAMARGAITLKKCGPDHAVLYDALTYTLCVCNDGSVEAAGVRLTDNLPTGLEHATGKNHLTWDLGNLGPGQSRTVEYQVVAKLAGRLCNHATATAAGGLRAEAEHCVTVVEAKLTLAKQGPDRRYVNQPAAYKLTVTNTGSTPLSNVTITDPLPAQTALVNADAGGRLAGNAVQWPIGTLPPGASRAVEIVLRAQAPGKVCNRATATADRGLTAQAEACTEFLPGAAALLLEVVDTDDPVEVGAQTSYKILVRNQGAVPATNVRVTGTAPKHEAVVRATGPADNRKDGQKVLYEPLTLQPGQEANYQVFVKTLEPGDVRFHVELTADQLTSGRPVVEEESTTIYADTPSPRLQPPEGARPGGPPQAPNR